MTRYIYNGPPCTLLQPVKEKATGEDGDAVEIDVFPSLITGGIYDDLDEDQIQIKNLIAHGLLVGYREEAEPEADPDSKGPDSEDQEGDEDENPTDPPSDPPSGKAPTTTRRGKGASA